MGGLEVDGVETAEHDVVDMGHFAGEVIEDVRLKGVDLVCVSQPRFLRLGTHLGSLRQPAGGR